MSDAFRESNSDTYRNVVTFQSGFGVIADQPFTIGSPTTTNSNLVTYNIIKPLGGISGYVGYTGTNTGIFIPNYISGKSMCIGFNDTSNPVGAGIFSNTNGLLINFIDPVGCSFNDNNGLICVDLISKQLQVDGDPRLDWFQQFLYDNGGNMVIDWSNRTMTGFNNGFWKINNLSTYQLNLSGTAPASMTSSGIKGQIATSGGFLYVCTGASQWGKVPLVSF